MLRRNVLIFHQGALGDFVLTRPLAVVAGRVFAQSRIIYITHAQKGLLAEKLLRLESVDVERGWHHLYGDASQLPPENRKLLAGAHIVISFMSAPADAFTAQVGQIAQGAQVLTINPLPPSDYAGHASDWLIEQLGPNLPLQEGTRQMVRSLSQRPIAPLAAGGGRILIHPGSGSPAKCWPLEKFIELGRRLLHLPSPRTRGEGRVRGCGGEPCIAGDELRFLLGEVELERWPTEAVERLSHVAPILRPTTYVSLMQELRSAGKYIGNDSGPAHLAGVLGVPTLCLFGPTNPAAWHPLGPRVSVLQQQPLESLTVEQVEERL